MERVLPVGSIVEIQGKKVMLLGAALKEHNGVLVQGYYAVRYPRGFVTIDSLGFVPADVIENVCARGFEDAAGEKYAEGVTKLYGELAGKSSKEAEDMLQTAETELNAATEKFRRERAEKES